MMCDSNGVINHEKAVSRNKRTVVLGVKEGKPLVPGKEKYAEVLVKHSRADSFVLGHSESTGFAINTLQKYVFEGH